MLRTDGIQNVSDNLETIKSSPIVDDTIVTVKLQTHTNLTKSVKSGRNKKS